MGHVIKMTDLNHPNLDQSIQALKKKIEWASLKDTMYCLEVIEDILSKVKQGQELYKDLMDKHMELGEDGKPLFNDKKEVSFKDPEVFKAKFSELLDLDVTIKGRLDMSRIHSGKLTAEELAPIKFLFHV